MVYLAKDDDFYDFRGDWIYCGGEKEVEIPEYIHGGLVTSTANMFCQSPVVRASPVTKVVLKHNHVTNMSQMFKNCENMTNLDLSEFNTSKVTNMSHMFEWCRQLKIPDFSNFDMSNVTDISHMFMRCNELTSSDLLNLDTSNVTNMNGTFSECMSLTNFDLSKFNTSNVTDMSALFYGCKYLTNFDLSNVDISKLQKINVMFMLCTDLTSLNLSNLDTSKITNMENVFRMCNKLKEIYARTKEDAERLKEVLGTNGDSTKFYIREKENCDFKIALGNDEIESIFLKDKNGELKQLKIYREKIIEV